MSEKNDGGRAFPSHPNNEIRGMTLRDWFAGRALASIITWNDYPVRKNGESGMEAVGRTAYEYADAMLKERAK